MKLKKLNDLAVTPSYATPGSGCFDLCSTETAMIYPGKAHIFGTGLSFEVPSNHTMLVFSRSGLGFKHHIRLSNCVGVVDSDYRGEVRISVHTDGEHPFVVNAGDRIAQAAVLPFKQQTFEVVKELTITRRSAGGFGSTGV